MSLLASALFAVVACTAPEYHQLDFFLGAWDVVASDGMTGTDRVESTVAGCAILERFDGPKGWSGVSLNRWVPSQKQWQQSWVDAKGQILELVGGLKDGKMVFTSDTPGKQQRVTYSPLPTGLRQLHEISTDGGKTWKIAFDGAFSRRR